MNSKFVLLTMILVLAVAGCTQQQQPQQPQQGNQPTTTPTQQPTTTPTQPVYTLSIDSPSAGETVGNDIAVRLSTNLKLAPAGPLVEGEGHFHVYLDGANEQRGPKTTFTFANASSGAHKIKAELHKGDHSPYGVEKEINVVVATPQSQPVKEFTLQAKQFEFVPNTITVKKGDIVKLTITSTDVPHGFGLPDFNVNVRLEPNQPATAEFTASKSGAFNFFCTVPCGSGHGGMKGTLIVTE